MCMYVPLCTVNPLKSMRRRKYPTLGINNCITLISTVTVLRRYVLPKYRTRTNSKRWVILHQSRKTRSIRTNRWVNGRVYLR